MYITLQNWVYTLYTFSYCLKNNLDDLRILFDCVTFRTSQSDQ